MAKNTDDEEKERNVFWTFNEAFPDICKPNNIWARMSNVKNDSIGKQQQQQDTKQKASTLSWHVRYCQMWCGLIPMLRDKNITHSSLPLWFVINDQFITNSYSFHILDHFVWLVLTLLQTENYKSFIQPCIGVYHFLTKELNVDFSQTEMKHRWAHLHELMKVYKWNGAYHYLPTLLQRENSTKSAICLWTGMKTWPSLDPNAKHLSEASFTELQKHVISNEAKLKCEFKLAMKLKTLYLEDGEIEKALSLLEEQKNVQIECQDDLQLEIDTLKQCHSLQVTNQIPKKKHLWPAFNTPIWEKGENPQTVFFANYVK